MTSIVDLESRRQYSDSSDFAKPGFYFGAGDYTAYVFDPIANFSYQYGQDWIGDEQFQYSGYRFDLSDVAYEGSVGPRETYMSLPVYVDTDSRADFFYGPLTKNIDSNDVFLAEYEGWEYSVFNTRHRNEIGARNVVGLGPGDDLFRGGRGNDDFAGGSGNDTAFGGTGNDLLYGDYTDVLVQTNSGQWRGIYRKAFLPSEEGDSSILGSAALNGDDYLDGQNGNDRLYGGKGNDQVYGGSGNDLLYGEAGDDQLQGGTGVDKIYGAAGNDQLDAGPRGEGAAELLVGGAGADAFHLSYVEPVATAQQNWWSQHAGTLVGTAASSAVSAGLTGLAKSVAKSFYESLPGGFLLGGVIGLLSGGAKAGADTIFANTSADSQAGGSDPIVIGDFDPREDVLFLPLTAGQPVFGIVVPTASVTTDNFSNVTILFASTQTQTSGTKIFAEVSLSSTFISDMNISTSNTSALQDLADTIVGTSMTIDSSGKILGAVGDFAEGQDAAGAWGSVADLGWKTPSGTETQVYGAFAPWNVFNPASNSGVAHVSGTFMGDIINVNDTAFAPEDTFAPSTALSNTPSIVYGWSGDDHIFTSYAADQVYAGAGADTVFAIGSSDGLKWELIDSGTGNDIIYAGFGNSRLFVDGGDGTDTADFSYLPDALTLDLSKTSEGGVTYSANTLGVSSTGNGTNSVPDTGGTSRYAIINVENLIGTSQADTLSGDAGDNIIAPGAGADVLSGGAGIDTLDYSGAVGPVVADINNNNSVQEYDINNFPGYFDEGTENYIVSTDSVSGFENIIGSAYLDLLFGNDLANTLNGGGGNDNIYANGGNDTIIYNITDGGEVAVFGGSGTDHLMINLDDGVSNGGTKVANIIQASGGAKLTTTDADGVAASVFMFGVETVTITLDNDGGIITGEGNLAAAGIAENTIYVHGGDGDDTINFSGLTDPIRIIANGNAGNDTLFGGAGKDILTGGEGADVKDGGAGLDTYAHEIRDLEDGDQIIDFSEGEIFSVEDFDGRVAVQHNEGLATLHLDTDGNGSHDTPGVLVGGISEQESLGTVQTKVDDDWHFTHPVDRGYLPDLLEKEPLDGELISGVDQEALIVGDSGLIEITFVDEDAGFANSLFFFTRGEDGGVRDAGMVFAKVDGPDRDDTLLEAGDSVRISGLHSGDQFGLGLVQDGFSTGLLDQNSEIEISEQGGKLSLAVLNENDEATVLHRPIITTEDPNGSISAQDDDGSLIIAFEDKTTTMNRDGDFNDAIFDVTILDEIALITASDTSS